MNEISKQLMKIAKVINQGSKNKTSSVKLSFNPQDICNELKIASKQYYKDKSICLRDKVLFARQLNSISDEYYKIHTAGYLTNLWQALTGQAGKSKEQMQKNLDTALKENEKLKKEQQERAQKEKQEELAKAQQLAQQQKKKKQLEEADYQSVIKGLQEQYTKVTDDAKEKIEAEIDSVNKFLEAIKDSDQLEAFQYNKAVCVDVTKPVKLIQKGGKQLLIDNIFDLKIKDYLIIENINLEELKKRDSDLTNSIVERFKVMKESLEKAKSFFDKIEFPVNKIEQCLDFLKDKGDAGYFAAYADLANGKIGKDEFQKKAEEYYYDKNFNVKQFDKEIEAIYKLTKDSYLANKQDNSNKVTKYTEKINEMIRELKNEFRELNETLQNNQILNIQPEKAVQEVQKNIK